MSLKPIDAKISKIGEGNVVLEIGKQRLILSSDVLPEGVEVGAKLNLYLLNSAEQVASEKKLAKIILEEILNGK